MGTTAHLRAPVLVALVAAGCAHARPPALPADPNPPATAYRLGCPDVVRVAFPGRPGWDAVASVGVDGRLPLGTPASPRVDGLTLAEAHAALCREAGLPADQVVVELADPRAGRVYLHGPVRDRVRPEAYRGPEPVLGFLARVGGLPGQSKLTEVYVVRPNVGAGGRPAVFRIDVPAVLTDGDHRTNVRLEPNDEVYVGESARSVLLRALPDWAKRPDRRDD